MIFLKIAYIALSVQTFYCNIWKIKLFLYFCINIFDGRGRGKYPNGKEGREVTCVLQGVFTP